MKGCGANPDNILGVNFNITIFISFFYYLVNSCYFYCDCSMLCDAFSPIPE